MEAEASKEKVSSCVRENGSHRHPCLKYAAVGMEDHAGVRGQVIFFLFFMLRRLLSLFWFCLARVAMHYYGQEETEIKLDGKKRD